MATDAQRIAGNVRGSPPCKDCEERHTACHDTCQRYKDWKAYAHKIKDAKKTYEEDWRADYQEMNRRNRWRKTTFLKR